MNRAVLLEPVDDPKFSALLRKLRKQIERSSNFRFAHQLYRFTGAGGNSCDDALRFLHAIVENPTCHAFLESSFESIHDEEFEIETPHEHCTMSAADETFEKILAAAADDRLGAYSASLRESTESEARRIEAVFTTLGKYRSFELAPGTRQDCETCQESNHHLFSTWFYGVAWDWCFLVTWPDSKRAWLGCLTDTD